jgi:hypothetical protein
MKKTRAILNKNPICKNPMLQKPDAAKTRCCNNPMLQKPDAAKTQCCNNPIYNKPIRNNLICNQLQNGEPPQFTAFVLLNLWLAPRRGSVGLGDVGIGGIVDCRNNLYQTSV